MCVKYTWGVMSIRERRKSTCRLNEFMTAFEKKEQKKKKIRLLKNHTDSRTVSVGFVKPVSFPKLENKIDSTFDRLLNECVKLKKTIRPPCQSTVFRLISVDATIIKPVRACVKTVYECMRAKYDVTRVLY